jgi:hypothetical protein
MSSIIFKSDYAAAGFVIASIFLIAKQIGGIIDGSDVICY